MSYWFREVEAIYKSRAFPDTRLFKTEEEIDSRRLTIQKTMNGLPKDRHREQKRLRLESLLLKHKRWLLTDSDKVPEEFREVPKKVILLTDKLHCRHQHHPCCGMNREKHEKHKRSQVCTLLHLIHVTMGEDFFLSIADADI